LSDHARVDRNQPFLAVRVEHPDVDRLAIDRGATLEHDRLGSRREELRLGLFAACRWQEGSVAIGALARLSLAAGCFGRGAGEPLRQDRSSAVGQRLR